MRTNGASKSVEFRESVQADRPVRVRGCCGTVAPGEGVGGPIVLSHCITMQS
jgi:hypothetical protein